MPEQKPLDLPKGFIAVQHKTTIHGEVLSLALRLQVSQIVGYEAAIFDGKAVGATIMTVSNTVCHVEETPALIDVKIQRALTPNFR
jgi:hypothetical protein